MATTNTNNSKKTLGPVLVGTNYDFWSIKMNTFLQFNNYWDMVETEFKEPDTNYLAAMSNAQKNVVESHRY